jgi:hypothetical protein
MDHQFKKISLIFLGDRDDARSTGNKRSPLMVLLIVALILGGLKLSTLIFVPNPEKDYWGRIIIPEAGSVVGEQFTMVGETQDIPSGNYI